MDRCGHLQAGPPGGLRQGGDQDAGPGRPGRQIYAVRTTLRGRIPDYAHARGPRHRTVDHVLHGLGADTGRGCDACPDACRRGSPHRRDGRHSILSARRDELRQGLPDLLDVHGPRGLGDAPHRGPPPRVAGRAGCVAVRGGPERGADNDSRDGVAPAPLQGGLLSLRRHVGPPRALGRPQLLHRDVHARLRWRGRAAHIRALAGLTRLHRGARQERPWRRTRAR